MNRVLNTRGNFAKFLAASVDGTTNGKKNNLYKGELFVNLVNAKLDGTIICYEYNPNVSSDTDDFQKVEVNRVNAGEIFVGTGITEGKGSDAKRAFYKLNPVTALSFGNNIYADNSTPSPMATAYKTDLKLGDKISLDDIKSRSTKFANSTGETGVNEWAALIKKAPLFTIYQYTGVNKSYDASYEWYPETGDLFFFTSHDLHAKSSDKALPGDVVIIKSAKSENIAACENLKAAYDLAVAGSSKYAAASDDNKESPRDMQTIVTKILYNSMHTASKGRLWADLICKDLKDEEGITEFLGKASDSYPVLLKMAGATDATGGTSGQTYDFNETILKGPSTELYAAAANELVDLEVLAKSEVTVDDAIVPLIPEIANAYNGAVFYIDKEGFKIGGQQLHVGDFIYCVTDEQVTVETTAGNPSTVKKTFNRSWVVWNESWIDKYIFSDLNDVGDVRQFATTDAKNHNITNKAFYNQIVVPGPDSGKSARAVDIKDYIKELYKVKADLDPDTGKLLVSQLPDAIFGGLHFAGIMSCNTLELKVGDKVARCMPGFYAADDDGTGVKARHFFELADVWELAYHDSAVRKYLRDKIIATYGSDRDAAQGGKNGASFKDDNDDANNAYERKLEEIIEKVNTRETNKGEWLPADEIELLDEFKALDLATSGDEVAGGNVKLARDSKIIDFLKGAYFIWSHDDSTNGHGHGPIQMYVDDRGYSVQDYYLINNDTDDKAGNDTPRVKYLTNGDWLVFDFTDANFVTKDDDNLTKTQMIKPISIVDAGSTLESIKIDGSITWQSYVDSLGETTGTAGLQWEIFTTPKFKAGRAISLAQGSSTSEVIFEAPNAVIADQEIITRKTAKTYKATYFDLYGKLVESDLLRMIPKTSGNNSSTNVLALFGEESNKNIVELRNQKSDDSTFDFSTSTAAALDAIGAWSGNIHDAVTQLVSTKLSYDNTYSTSAVKDIRLPFKSGTLSTVEELAAAYEALATLIAKTYLKVVNDIDPDWIPTIQNEKKTSVGGEEKSAKRFINSYIKQHYGKNDGNDGKFGTTDESALYGIEFNTTAANNGGTDVVGPAVYFIGLNANLKAKDLGVTLTTAGNNANGVSIDIETAKNFGIDIKNGAIAVGVNDAFKSDNNLEAKHKYSLPYRGDDGTSVLLDTDAIIDCGIWE